MKKYLYTFLIVIILIGSLLLINNLGIVSFREWGENIIKSTPFVKDYVKTGQEYQELLEENEVLEKDNEKLLERIVIQKDQIELLEKENEELKKLNEELQEEIQSNQTDSASSKEKLDKLLSIYANMNPKSAADIISNLNKDFALEILSGLEDKDAAAILESMDVQKAAELSQGIQN